jgi:branched-chain amino acid transport system substrate-binding protein
MNHFNRYNIRNKGKKFKSVSKVLVAALVIIIIVIAGILGGYYYQETISAAHKPILIGLETPLSGTYAPVGQLTVDGATLAVNYINSHGGVLGHPLKLVIEDEGTTTSSAISAAEILIEQDHVHYMIGPFWSGDVEAVLPLAYSHKVVEMLTVSSVNALLAPPMNQYLFRTTLPDSGWAYAIIQWLKLIGAKNAAFLAEDYLYTHEVANYTITLAKQNGINIEWVSYYPGTATDYSSAIAKLASLKPDAVVVIMESTNGIDFQKQYSANPITRKIPILYFDTILNIPANAESVDAAVPNGMQYVFIGETATYTNLSAQLANELQSTYGVSFSNYAADTYDGVMVLAQAIERAGTYTNTTKVAEALMQTNYLGPGGHIVFEPDHEPVVGIGYLTGVIYQVRIINGSIYYEIIWTPNVANASAINPATGQPY